MIRRLLIANRGEIAVRIAATAHRLGIGTVGVYSEADTNAVHVDVVDVAVGLGGSKPVESYLRMEALLQAAIDHGADAVHPGYGFLAENADFARLVIEAGLTWVGPGPDQIALLGDKIAAKRTAREAGVPASAVIEVTPGSVADGWPLPALVKAAAGGGGRGMRIVRNLDEAVASVEAASREAAAAFGDGRVFVEPYVEHARHVEVQILGDRQGNVIHLGERECSIQRRNQKVVEEAPSPGITPEVRSAVCDGAVELARHVGYHNAGTVEFLVGEDGSIDLLEVNTRLQVEHPVTEAVTGLDLVELQLRVAAGEPLAISQNDVVISGHAIEARVVAEDPATGWLPSTGTVTGFEVDDDVRVDAGVREGTRLPPDYDSLLAKMIAHAPTRSAAARRLGRALRRARIGGVDTNIATLAAILEEPDFLAANTPTSYLDTHPDVLTASGPGGDDKLALLLGAVFATEQRERASDPVTGFAPSGWRNLRTMGQRQIWRHRDTDVHIEYVMEAPDAARVWIGPWPRPREDGSLPPDGRRVATVRLFDRGSQHQTVELDGVRRVVSVRLEGGAADTSSPAGSLTWEQVPPFVVHEAEEAGSGPICPLPGTVIAVHVRPGQAVADGELLMVVEAMKMEHQITAMGDATVTRVNFDVGDRVDAGDLLVELHHEEV